MPAMTELHPAFQRVRERTSMLAAPLSAEDCCVQSMPDASPVKWHLAHTSWFFETFALEPREARFVPFDQSYRVLFNSYYNGVGAKHPRSQRGLLTRPALADVLAYRANVEQRVRALMQSHADDAALQALVTLGLHHEQQHQELLLTDVLHLLSCNPLAPAYAPQAMAPTAHPATAMQWLEFDGAMVDLGHAGDGFCFDNELPRHPTYATPYALADRLVNNGEYAAFVADGAYRRPELWLAEGWDWLAAQAIAHPLYWRSAGHGSWRQFGLHGELPLDFAAPVAHLSYFEADAYARWAGARLPTEAEWEAAAAPLASAQLSQAPHAESCNGMLMPRASAAKGLRELFGEVWQWTQSSYAPYPGFRTAPGAVGEYNGKFMVNQYVLRGSSRLTSTGHARLSYRNFFPTTARWQMTGLRLAKDIAG